MNSRGNISWMLVGIFVVTTGATLTVMNASSTSFNSTQGTLVESLSNEYSLDNATLSAYFRATCNPLAEPFDQPVDALKTERSVKTRQLASIKMLRDEGKNLYCASSAGRNGKTERHCIRGEIPPRPTVLDNTYGGTGIVSTQFDGFRGGGGILVRPDGRILHAGWKAYWPHQVRAGCLAISETAAFIMVKPDGAIDTSFGTGGVYEIPPPCSMSGSSAGRIIYADASNVYFGASDYASAAVPPSYKLSALRFDASGAISAVDTANAATLAFPDRVPQFFYEPSRTANGKFIVVGSAPGGSSSKWTWSVLRLNADLTFDPTFANGTGYIHIETNTIPYPHVYSANARIYAAEQSDGKVVVLVSTFGANDPNPAVRTSEAGARHLRRYLANGQPDGDFLLENVPVIFGKVPGRELATHFLIQPDDKILVAGVSTIGKFVSPNYQPAIARFHANGTPDETFGEKGVILFKDPCDLAAAPTQVMYHSDGSITLSGIGKRADKTNFVGMARVSAQGKPDKEFGFGNGLMYIPLTFPGYGPGTDASIGSINGTFQSDGRSVFSFSAALNVGPISWDHASYSVRFNPLLKILDN